MKYKTLAELRDAYAQNKLTAPLMIDNDWVGVHEGDEEIFDSDPQTLLTDALDLLGIPHEHV